MAQAEASARDAQIPLVVLHPEGGKHADDLAVLRLVDLVALAEGTG